LRKQELSATDRGYADWGNNGMDNAQLDRWAVAATAGDRGAFRELVLATQTALRHHLAVRCQRFDLVEEIVQESYLAAYASLGRYQPRGCFVAWLQAIGRHHLQKELRRRRREAVLSNDQFADLLIDEAAEAEELAIAEEQSRARSRAIDHCLNQLGRRSATILHRHHVERVPLKKLAQQFKRTEPAINKLLVTLRRKLRDCLLRAQIDG